MDLFLAARDERLNEKAYIVPGLGDAGDRLYGLAAVAHPYGSGDSRGRSSRDRLGAVKPALWGYDSEIARAGVAFVQ